MKPASIWWNQIGNSLRFLTRVSDSMKDCRSAVLHVPVQFPWRSECYGALDIRRSSFGCDRRLARLAWPQGADPGAFLLENLCSPEIAAGYWPGESCAAYLGGLQDIELCDCYVWVTGIHSKSDLSRWTEFIRLYEACAEPSENRAVFLLEYDGDAAEHPGIQRIEYRVESYDCRVFCLETAAALQNTQLLPYQAELAQRIGGNDPEFCAALLQQGDTLLQNPRQAVSDACVICPRFPPLTETHINSAAWKAAIVLLFPLLEQYRLDFIARYEPELCRHLPICNSNGEPITDPFDLELGPLCHILATCSSVSPADCEAIRLCRRVRNLLAHNKPIPCPDIRRVLEL